VKIKDYFAFAVRQMNRDSGIEAVGGCGRSWRPAQEKHPIELDRYSATAKRQLI
jgi:hypothetical protein